jgi:vesicular inhibitory amino acid transporter
MANDDLDYSRSNVDANPEVRGSLLRQHLEAYNPGSNGEGASNAETSPLLHATSHHSSSDFRERERKASEQDLSGALHNGSFSGGRRPSIFAIAPHLATPPLVGSFGSYRTYGTLPDVEVSSMAQAGEMWRQQQEGATNVPDGEHQPILVKEVEQDGKIVLTVDGQSTLPQTIFNSIKYVPLPSFFP